METVKESNPPARPGAQSANAGTDEIFPRRICAEIFRLSPYCPARAIRTAMFRTKHQPASEDKSQNSARRGRLRDFFTPCSPRFCQRLLLMELRNRRSLFDFSDL